MNLRNKKKEVEKITQVLFVIDESGSMCGCRDQTISGINEQIQEFKKHNNVNTFVTLVTFSSKVNNRLVNQPISELDELDDNSYQPNGSTALYDAVAQTILTEENRKYNTKNITRLLIIVTDGEENSSKEHTLYNNGQGKIAEMIKRVQISGWTITYLGANQDLAEVHKNLGIDMSNIAMYDSSAQGTVTAFATMSKDVTDYMCKRSMAVTPAELKSLSAKFYNKAEKITNVSDNPDDGNNEKPS